MGRKYQFLLIVCSSLAFASIANHFITRWMHIRTSFGERFVMGPASSKISVFMAGSSLAGYGLDWEQVGNAMKERIEAWGTAGSSPCEWEVFQPLAAETNHSFIVISAYDLNEYFLCDFRAELVPLPRALKDLWQIRASWDFSKYILSQYPMTWIRLLFPTVGRSDGVMVGVREKLRRCASVLFSIKAEAGPTLSFSHTSSAQDMLKNGNVSNWESGYMLRRLTGMREGCQGRHTFEGPKHLALIRMLLRAQQRGRVLVIVLPVSRAYVNEFLTPKVQRDFEQSLIEAQDAAPQACWLRLDRLNELQSNELFGDLVHMNSFGQGLATEALLGKLKELKLLP